MYIHSTVDRILLRSGGGLHLSGLGAPSPHLFKEVHVAERTS